MNPPSIVIELPVVIQKSHSLIQNPTESSGPWSDPHEYRSDIARRLFFATPPTLLYVPHPNTLATTRPRTVRRDSLHMGRRCDPVRRSTSRWSSRWRSQRSLGRGGKILSELLATREKHSHRRAWIVAETSEPFVGFATAHCVKQVVKIGGHRRHGRVCLDE